MARNDGTNRICVRNQNLAADAISDIQQHNEREKEIYKNPDIVPERTPLNVYFKKPSDSYETLFKGMVSSGELSTRGTKKDAKLYGELVFDVNSAYFHNHGGYEFAKQFYRDAYQAAVRIVGSEDYILSAVMHADERNKAMSEALGYDVYHYHLHVLYIPVVEKKILWTKRCKDKSLVGTVKKTIMQVSSGKKWHSQQATDENANPLFTRNGKPILRKSYSIIQDTFWNTMREAGYMDVERGERGSTEEHLTITEFKVMKETERLQALTQQVEKKEARLDAVKQQTAVQKTVALTFDEIDRMGKKKLFSDKIEFTPEEADTLKALARKGAASKAKISGFKQQLAEEQHTSGIWKKRYESLRDESQEYIEAKQKDPERMREAIQQILTENTIRQTTLEKEKKDDGIYI